MRCLTWPMAALWSSRVFAALEIEDAIFRAVVMVTDNSIDRLVLGTRKGERFVIVIDPATHPNKEGPSNQNCVTKYSVQEVIVVIDIFWWDFPIKIKFEFEIPYLEFSRHVECIDLR